MSCFRTSVFQINLLQLILNNLPNHSVTVESVASPLRGAEVGLLDDLFVDPERRALGAGEALLLAFDGIAAEEGWPVVRWITHDNSYRARGLYELLSHRSDWITYKMTAASIGRA